MENVRGLLEKIGFNINSLGITSETFDKIEEGLGTLQSMLIKVPNALIGSNYTRIINVIKEKINTKIKDQIKKQIIQAIDSNFMNYFINLESITKILTLFKNNKEVANVFINQIMKLSEYITKIRSKLQNGNFDISELLQKIREDYLSSNKNDIYTIIKGILDSKTNSTLLSDFSLKLLNFIQQFFEYIKNLPNAFKTFGINRLLSIDYNNRRTEETGSLTCKFDETISEDLTASPEDISSLILKTGQNYTLNIQSGINIKADKDKTDKCTNNNENIKKQVTFNNLSGLDVEGSKKRFKFSIRIKISRTWRRPSFFYLFMKLRMKLKSKGNLRNLDVEEDTGSYCLIDDESNSDNVQLSCYGNNDNIDENTEKITLSNFTSDYIELPENLSVTNSTEGNEPNSNNNGNNANRYFMKSKSSGLSGGAIAGIVIACVAVLAIVISLMLYFRKKSNVPNPNQTTNEVTDSVNHLKISDKI